MGSITTTMITSSMGNITFIPCQREIARRGRRALNVRRLLKAVRLELPSTARLTTDTWRSKMI